ncbi:phage holin family protein [Piscinibacter sp.]|uniref:phage holin family protein n=1 Tax=Piscinibacter sp. TaxID=1903157 RepID=UPI002C84EFD6|nr:phage holin family protein [Albitalea sp.]HUG21529.1 phage holin family protein [Albitalea sp.]
MSTVANDIHSTRADSTSGEGRSLAGLFSDLWRETTTLVHDEAELAKADMTEKVSQAVTGARSMAIGGAILFAGFIVLLFAAVNALGLVLPLELAPWLSPLIVGGLVMLVGYVALAAGRRELKTENLMPSRSIDSLRRDGQTVKEHTR